MAFVRRGYWVGSGLHHASPGEVISTSTFGRRSPANRAPNAAHGRAGPRLRKFHAQPGDSLWPAPAGPSVNCERQLSAHPRTVLGRVSRGPHLLQGVLRLVSMVSSRLNIAVMESVSIPRTSRIGGGFHRSTCAAGAVGDPLELRPPFRRNGDRRDRDPLEAGGVETRRGSVRDPSGRRWHAAPLKMVSIVLPRRRFQVAGEVQAPQRSRGRPCPT
jgi:hypothetical protein